MKKNKKIVTLAEGGDEDEEEEEKERERRWIRRESRRSKSR